METQKLPKIFLTDLNKSIFAIINGNGKVTEDIDEILDSFAKTNINLNGKEAQKPCKIGMQNNHQTVF